MSANRNKRLYKALENAEFLGRMCYNESARKTLFILKNLALAGGHMFKFDQYCQLGLADFNQLVGLKVDPENR